MSLSLALLTRAVIVPLTTGRFLAVVRHRYPCHFQGILTAAVVASADNNNTILRFPGQRWRNSRFRDGQYLCRPQSVVCTAAGHRGLPRKEAFMLEARPEVTGFRCRVNFVTTLKVTRAIMVHIAVSITLPVAAGHVRWHRGQDVLGFTVVIVTGGD